MSFDEAALIVGKVVLIGGGCLLGLLVCTALYVCGFVLIMRTRTGRFFYRLAGTARSTLTNNDMTKIVCAAATIAADKQAKA